MKKLLPFLLGTLLAAGFVGCSTTSARWEKADLRTRNEFLIQQHLLACVERSQIFPVYNLGFREVESFYDRFPDLRDARNEFLRADGELKEILNRDDNYREIRAWFENQPVATRSQDEYRQRNQREVYSRLQQTSPEYRLARDKYDRALYRSNRMTVERIIEEAARENRVLPVDWIGKDAIAQYSARF